MSIKTIGNALPICEMTEKEFNSLPGFGAAQLLNQLPGKNGKRTMIIDVAKYGKSRIVAFSHIEGKQEIWQKYSVCLSDRQSLESAIAVDTFPPQVQNAAVSK